MHCASEQVPLKITLAFRENTEVYCHFLPRPKLHCLLMDYSTFPFTVVGLKGKSMPIMNRDIFAGIFRQFCQFRQSANSSAHKPGEMTGSLHRRPKHKLQGKGNGNSVHSEFPSQIDYCRKSSTYNNCLLSVKQRNDWIVSESCVKALIHFLTQS